MIENLPKRRRWFQFGLRTLLGLVLVVSVGMSWFAWRFHRAREQQEVVEAILERGGDVKYDHEFTGTAPQGPTWLRELLGKDFFCDVAAVYIEGDYPVTRLQKLPALTHLYLVNRPVTDAELEEIEVHENLVTLELAGTKISDAGLEKVRHFKKLRMLGLNYTQITDAGLTHLKGLRNLQMLCLDHTRVTDAGVEELQEALPNLRILRNR